MRVLVACEFSGIVRDAFAACGHYAVSVDLLGSESTGMHLVGDVRQMLQWGWDLMIAHPPCTYLARSGARWWRDPTRQRMADDAYAFVRQLADAPIHKIAIENPIGQLSTRWRKPDQIIQPWQYGHGETKATCLWLKNLPPLVPTNVVQGRAQRVLLMPPSPTRWRERSRTYSGIAAAMAAQWG